jgi:hypothetical protein
VSWQGDYVEIPDIDHEYRAELVGVVTEITTGERPACVPDYIPRGLSPYDEKGILVDNGVITCTGRLIFRNTGEQSLTRPYKGFALVVDGPNEHLMGRKIRALAHDEGAYFVFTEVIEE